jgi:hypothetical protein
MTLDDQVRMIVDQQVDAKLSWLYGELQCRLEPSVIVNSINQLYFKPHGDKGLIDIIQELHKYSEPEYYI